MILPRKCTVFNKSESPCLCTCKGCCLSPSSRFCARAVFWSSTSPCFYTAIVVIVIVCIFTDKRRNKECQVLLVGAKVGVVFFRVWRPSSTTIPREKIYKQPDFSYKTKKHRSQLTQLSEDCFCDVRNIFYAGRRIPEKKHTLTLRTVEKKT